MNNDLLALGMFVFGMHSLPYQELERRSSWKHGKTPRYGARDAGQYLGAGEQTITLNGLLVPEIAGQFSDIGTLHEMAGAGEIYPLVLGTGDVLGEFRILAIDDRWRNLVIGGVPRHVDFAIDLDRADG